MEFGPYHHESSLRERLASLLREAIFVGKLKPGERIVESQLAKDMNVGQPTIREALQVLEYEGLITRASKRGCRVTDLSLEDVTKIYEVRTELEVLAVDKIPTKLISRLCEELETIVAKMSKAEQKGGDFNEYARLDLEFHRTIWKASGNEYLVKALDAITVPLFAFGRIVFLQNVKTIPEKDTDLHRDIVDIIRSRAASATKRDRIRKIMEIFCEGALRDYEVSKQHSANAKPIPAPMVGGK